MVGGTAEEYWAADEYHQTDLDLCVSLTRKDEATLRELGFSKEARHWWHETVKVAVEFPDSKIDGDESRTVVDNDHGGARIIGPEDLYLDRLRQSTMNEDVEDVHFFSALAVMAGIYEFCDRAYLRGELSRIMKAEPLVGRAMRKVDSKVTRRVRKRLAETER
ncbi:MAG: hypothetical protein ACXVQV_11820 [Actinomycetota bacterium]